MMTNYYSKDELEQFGFKELGQNVMISRKASVYGAENMVIGSNVRIDDFCFLIGKIQIGNNIHIAQYSALFGGEYGIEMHDFAGLSSRCAIYASSDDYSGEYMTNPTVPAEFCNVTGGRVILAKHVIIGTGTSIMPNVTIGEGTAVGGMSLVRNSLEPWGIYAGVPCRKIKERKKKLLELEKNYLEALG